ncbi:hypothetical protein DAI22_12g192200 [Oryza sativa Japonica Group]|nr:hypothetical protein DAI22_12g192200 [Oryza sativa Japonica Group]
MVGLGGIRNPLKSLKCVGIAESKRETVHKTVESMVAEAERKPSSSELVNGSLVQQGWKHCQ